MNEMERNAVEREVGELKLRVKLSETGNLILGQGPDQILLTPEQIYSLRVVLAHIKPGEFLAIDAVGARRGRRFWLTAGLRGP